MNKARPKYRDYDVYEVLDELVTIKDKDNQVEWLSTNFRDHQPLQYILKFNYCRTIVSRLPDGEPPFNKGETDGPTPASLWSYLRSFPLIVVSQQSQKLKMMQVERIFIEMLEAIEPKEAEMLCLAKDRQLESRWALDVNVFKRAFPQLAIQDAVMPKIEPAVEPTAEEKADKMLEEAKALKAAAKEYNAKARDLEKEAKAILEAVDESEAE